MPKRNRNVDDSDYFRRKIRKLEKMKSKIKRREERLSRQMRSDSSSCSSASPVLSQIEGENEIQPEVDLTSEMVPIMDEVELGPSTSTEQDANLVVTPSVQAESYKEVEVSQPELDDEILDLLGQTPSKDKKLGAEIQTDLALRMEHIATTGLTKESRKELLEKYLVPKNCIKIDAPKLNPEIKAALSDMLLKKDKALENKQLQLAASISCIGDALTKLICSEHRDQTVIKLLIEGNRLLCDAQHNESMTRRSFICPAIKKDIKDHLYNTEIDNFLFGEKLADTLKAAKAISKSGAEIKITNRKTTTTHGPKQSAAQSLNRKPPLRTARQTGVTRRSELPAPAPRPPPRQLQPTRQLQPPRQPLRFQHPHAPRR